MKRSIMETIIRQIAHKQIICFLTGFAMLTGTASLSAHPWKPAHYVIVDTDCGLDDYRALCLMLATPDIRVLGIVTSDGVMDAISGYVKVRSLLEDMHHEGIATGMYHQNRSFSEECKTARDFQWGQNKTDTLEMLPAKEMITRILGNTRDSISYVCLGSLSTIKFLEQNMPGLHTRIKQVIWSSKENYKEDNFNYQLDTNAFEFVSHHTIPLKIISSGSPGFSYSNTLCNRILQINNGKAKKFAASLSLQSPFSGTLFDELTAMYLHSPSLFRSDPGTAVQCFIPDGADLSISCNEIIPAILSGTYTTKNQVIMEFPLDTSMYFPDLRKNMLKVIEKYGMEEWSSAVLANEMHRHLGAYSILGVKMGIRAREYFGAGVDELEVLSYAGTTPPYSCMNDGLQMSTGATLGHGLIRISADSITFPRAEFTYLGNTIIVSLKETYRKQIEKSIRELNIIYGLDSNVYWDLVRVEALNYWANWDRHEIFDIWTDNYILPRMNE